MQRILLLIYTTWKLALATETADAQNASSLARTRMLCPMDYWAALVNTSGGPFGTERTFKLQYMPDDLSADPVCQFCPQVGCYVMKQRREPNLPPQKRTTTTTPVPTTTTTAFTTTTPGMYTDESGQTANVSNAIPTSEPNDSEEGQYAFYMSCDWWSQLPNPADIVSYLDCVMIGERNSYYLFIYEPRFAQSPVPVVDCVDADFLAWIPNGTQLLGLELGFRMKAIPPFLFLYYEAIMKETQYICIDGSSLENKSIPYNDTQRFSSSQLRQIVFRSNGLLRSRQPPNPPVGQYATGIQSEEVVATCPNIILNQPANITADSDCQFSPTALLITKDSVSKHEARRRCNIRSIRALGPKQRKRKQHTGLVEELRVPSSVLHACLLVLVMSLTIGMIVAFCVLNAEKLMLCRTRSRKRREREAALAAELAEQAAKEAAAAAAAAAEAEGRQQNAWHPIYGRYGMVPPTMGGAFGAFATRTMDFIPNQQQVMGMNPGQNQIARPVGGYPGAQRTNN